MPRLVLSVVALLAGAAPALAAGDAGHVPLDVSAWAVLPFAVLLLAIALLPLLGPHFWHNNLRKALVSAGLAVPVVAYLIYLHLTTERPVLGALIEALLEYVDFIVLLGALYTVAGGVVLQGHFRTSPLRNAGLLLLGAVLANFVGTTGASMLLIRPVLRMNHHRPNRAHIPLFFIFVVSNLGGLLTPLGDPPLFLGFLHGVDFFWTLRLWPVWLVGVGAVLAIFLVWDSLLSRSEPPEPSAALAVPLEHAGPPRLRGRINLVLLAGVVLAVLLQSEQLLGPWRLTRPWPSLLMALLALLSLWRTPTRLRTLNGFSWEAIIEVAVLFVGIFVTMVPALAYLSAHRDALNVTEPWQYFWMTGILSAVLDNAPTYMTFAALAAGGRPFSELAVAEPLILQAISVGAVFMGALTYIGNGPNFMVKAIAEHMGYPMPTFLGYLARAALVLLPVFALVTWLFFV